MCISEIIFRRQSEQVKALTCCLDPSQPVPINETPLSPRSRRLELFSLPMNSRLLSIGHRTGILCFYPMVFFRVLVVAIPE
jgi:hypothetical protein